MIITLAQSVEALQFALDIDGVPTSFDEKEQENADNVDANGEGGDNTSSGPGSPTRKSRRVSRTAASSFYQYIFIFNSILMLIFI